MDAGGAGFKVDASLQRLALIAYAASLWNESNTAPFFHRDNRFGCKSSTAYISALIKEKEEEFEKINFPRKILNEIIYAFKCLGDRICLWYDYVQNVLEITPNLAKTLSWTSYGTVDEGKIIEMWLNSKEETLLLESLYYMACSCASVEYIKAHWEEMLEFCAKNRKKKLKFIVCSIFYFANPPMHSRYFKTELKGYKRSYYKEEYMFSLSAKEACSTAARYYWNLLNSKRKRKLLLKTARAVVDAYWIRVEYDVENNFYNFGRRLKDCESENRKDTLLIYKRYNLVDLYAFLLMQMSEDEIKKHVLSIPMEHHIIKIPPVLVTYWPWEEFFFLALDATCKYFPCLAGLYFFSMFTKIFEIMKRNNDFGLNNKTRIHTRMFFAVWENQFTFLKDDVDSSSFYGISPYQIYCVFDLEILKFFFNFKPDKNKFLEEGGYHFRKLIETGQFELLKKFLEVVLQSEDDRQIVREICLDSTEDFLSENRLDIVDEILDWGCGTDEERNKWKCGIDFMAVCAKFFCDDEIEVADKILKWRFDSCQEKRLFMENYKPYRLFWLEVIWKKKRISFMDNLSKFFVWFSDSDDKILKRFKNKMFNPDVLKNFLILLVHSKDRPNEIFQMIHELLYFCLPHGRITRLKREIYQESAKFITGFASGKYELDLLDNLLDWTFKCKKDKQRAVKKFLRTPRGARFVDHYSALL